MRRLCHSQEGSRLLHPRGAGLVSHKKCGGKISVKEEGSRESKSKGAAQRRGVHAEGTCSSLEVRAGKEITHAPRRCDITASAAAAWRSRDGAGPGPPTPPPPLGRCRAAPAVPATQPTPPALIPQAAQCRCAAAAPRQGLRPRLRKKARMQQGGGQAPSDVRGRRPQRRQRHSGHEQALAALPRQPIQVRARSQSRWNEARQEAGSKRGVGALTRVALCACLEVLRQDRVHARLEPGLVRLPGVGVRVCVCVWVYGSSNPPGS